MDRRPGSDTVDHSHLRFLFGFRIAGWADSHPAGSKQLKWLIHFQLKRLRILVLVVQVAGIRSNVLASVWLVPRHPLDFDRNEIEDGISH